MTRPEAARPVGRHWRARCSTAVSPRCNRAQAMPSQLLPCNRTRKVVDQAHLHGIIQRTHELGLELISVGLADEGTDEDQRPAEGPKAVAGNRATSKR
jgi:hypothetical protein